jgi:uncharacterized membrane protein YcaP (DUF421 family)
VTAVTDLAMTDLFHLSMPLWEFFARAIAVYVILLVFIRVSGKRAMGQFTSFDMLLIVLLGNAVQNALLGEDHSLTGGILLAALLMSLNWGVGWIAARSRRMEKLIEGEPVVLAKDGKLYENVLRRELVSRNDFFEALRQNGELRLEEVRIAMLETDGQISVIPIQRKE